MKIRTYVDGQPVDREAAKEEIDEMNQKLLNMRCCSGEDCCPGLAKKRELYKSDEQ